MINIVGRKITMQQGESGAFRVILRDCKGNEVPLSDTDTITIRMKYTMEADYSLTKSATIVKIDGIIYHIFEFNSEDTKNLLTGDYNYDVILEGDNKRFTIVPKSLLIIEESMSLKDIENNDNSSIIMYDADTTIDYYSIITSTPLVGTFNAVSYNKVDMIDSEIIVF